MRTRTAAALTLLLAAGTLGTLTGTATAGPPEGHGLTITQDGYALTALASADGALLVHLDVFDPLDRAPFADLEVFVAGYECVTGEEDSVPATMRTLRSASAVGTLPLTCGSEEGTVTGTAVVEGVTWQATGRPVTDVVPPSAGDPRLRTTVTRQAAVAGSVRVSVPGLGVDTVATGDAGELRSVTTVPVPGRG